MDLDRSLLDRMRSQAGTRRTRRTRRENATALRGLLRWGATQGYVTAEQAELLPLGVYDLIGGVSGTEAPPRRRREREAGQSEDYVSNEDAPSGAQIVCPGEHLALALPKWGRLAPELARGGASCSSSPPATSSSPLPSTARRASSSNPRRSTYGSMGRSTRLARPAPAPAAPTCTWVTGRW